MNPTVPRKVLIDLCELLEHDPNRVGRIVIEPDTITVEYVHPVVKGSES